MPRCRWRPRKARNSLDGSNVLDEHVEAAQSSIKPTTKKFPWRKASAGPTDLSSFDANESLLAQCRSKIVKLPAEIRCMIWEFVLGGHCFHIAPHMDGKLALDAWKWYPRYIVDAWDRKDLRARKLCSLLLTCRLLYNECSHMLYSLSEIYADSHFAISRLPLCLSTDNLHALSSLTLRVKMSLYDFLYAHVAEDWETAWKDTVKFRGLKRLHVVLVADRPRSEFVYSVDEFVRGSEEVGHIKHLLVELQYKIPNRVGRIEDRMSEPLVFVQRGEW